MNELLQKAVAELAALPEDRQAVLATQILAILRRASGRGMAAQIADHLAHLLTGAVRLPWHQNERRDRLPLRSRLEVAYRVRAVCAGADPGAADAMLRRLPPLEGDLPGPNRLGIIFASCDDRYFHRYGIHLAQSAVRHSPAQACHLHLVEPTLDSLDLAARLKEEHQEARLTFSFERAAAASSSIGTDKVGYVACTRFARVWQLLVATGSPIIALDADSLVRRPLTAAVLKCGGGDVALLLRLDSREAWKRVLGATLIVLPTEPGRRFIRDCAVALAQAVQAGTRWGADQLVLYETWRWYGRHVPQLRVVRLRREHSDWRCEEDSPIWHAKGGRKQLLEPVFDRLSAGSSIEDALRAPALVRVAEAATQD